MWSNSEYIQLLSSKIENKLDIYSYKLARYMNRADVDLRNYDQYDYYDVPYNLNDPDLLRAPSTNVIKSVIDSLVSKLANNKVRPFFSPVDGTYKTKKVIRQAQQFFDQYYDEIHLNQIVSNSFKDACIFDIGYIMVNPFTYEIERIPPYCISVLDTQINEPNTALIKFRHLPNDALSKYGLDSDNQYVNIEMLVTSDKAILYIDEKEVKTTSLNSYPIVEVYYNKPVHMNKTVSVVDELEGIQTQIDLINNRISSTTQLTPANIVFIDENSNLKASDVNNKDAQIYPVGIQPGNTANPVTIMTPVPLDPYWDKLLEFYINKAYDMVGISQLSAQSRKPSGLDSGVALQTMEDIESDRFETQVDHYISTYVNITRKLIDVVPEDQEILPSNKWQSTMKWSDLKEQTGLFKVQYSAATSLSKDPAERAKQIIQMSQVGLIQPTKAAELMDMPDLTDAYTDAEAMEMAVAAVISNAVEHNQYFIPDYVSYQSLTREICSEQNQLFISMKPGEDNTEIAESLRRLNKLSEMLDNKLVELGLVDLTPDTDAVTEMNGEQNMENMNSDSGLALTNAAQAVNMAGM